MAKGWFILSAERRVLNRTDLLSDSRSFWLPGGGRVVKEKEGQRKQKESLGDNCSYPSKGDTEWRRVDIYII